MLDCLLTYRFSNNNKYLYCQLWHSLSMTPRKFYISLRSLLGSDYLNQVITILFVTLWQNKLKILKITKVQENLFSGSLFFCGISCFRDSHLTYEKIHKEKDHFVRYIETQKNCIFSVNLSKRWLTISETTYLSS